MIDLDAWLDDVDRVLDENTQAMHRARLDRALGPEPTVRHGADIAPRMIPPPAPPVLTRAEYDRGRRAFLRQERARRAADLVEAIARFRRRAESA